MVFLPQEAASRLACQEEIERAVRGEGQIVLGWRDVPVNADMPMSPRLKRKNRLSVRSSLAAARTYWSPMHWNANCISFASVHLMPFEL